MTVDEYDFWVFDLDGTLVDAEWTYTRSVFDEVGTRLDQPFSDRQATIVWHGLTGRRDDALRSWGVEPEEFWSVFHDIEDPSVRAKHTYLYDDAAFVSDLDTPIALVTHCQRFLTEPVLDELDIRDWFDVVLCCTDETGWKPDPTPIRTVMNELGVNGNGATGVMAGDGPADVGAAWNAGLDAIHVERHDPNARGHCVRGDYRVRSFRELTGIDG